jgi:hypothetical protein
MQETPAPANAPSVRQGCSLIAGGALLGFFGCLGGLGLGSEVVAFAFVLVGAVVVLAGVVKVVALIWQRMSKPLDR